MLSSRNIFREFRQALVQNLRVWVLGFRVLLDLAVVSHRCRRCESRPVLAVHGFFHGFVLIGTDVGKAGGVFEPGGSQRKGCCFVQEDGSQML